MFSKYYFFITHGGAPTIGATVLAESHISQSGTQRGVRAAGAGRGLVNAEQDPMRMSFKSMDVT